MADPKGFLKHGREVAARRPVEERVKDWNEVYPDGVGRALLPIITTQAGRCMDCGIPFCHNGCPLGNLIPEWTRSSTGRRSATSRGVVMNPLGSATARRSHHRLGGLVLV